MNYHPSFIKYIPKYNIHLLDLILDQSILYDKSQKDMLFKSNILSEYFTLDITDITYLIDHQYNSLLSILKHKHDIDHLDDVFW